MSHDVHIQVGNMEKLLKVYMPTSIQPTHIKCMITLMIFIDLDLTMCINNSYFKKGYIFGTYTKPHVHV
jgi:hypothetical protein